MKHYDLLFTISLFVFVAVSAVMCVCSLVDALNPPSNILPYAHRPTSHLIELAVAADMQPPTLYPRPRGESYDQENLNNLARKRSSTGCAAVYDAPNGELRYCP
jgi:hypothetical protein